MGGRRRFSGHRPENIRHDIGGSRKVRTRFLDRRWRAEAARSYIEEAGYTALPGYLPERPAYRLAQNEGYAVTETRFHGLKERADALIQSLIDKVAGEGARHG